MNSEFDQLLQGILNGTEISSEALLPFLSIESLQQRVLHNKCLAGAYLAADDEQSLERARVFAERAWILSGFSEELLPLYRQVHERRNDHAAIQEAYKRVGLEAARRGLTGEALSAFNRWQHCLVHYDGTDNYHYDYDILDCVKRLAAAHQFTEYNSDSSSGKIRMGYLIKGMTDVNSVMVKLNLFYAQHHDRSRFEVTVVFPETKPVILGSAQGQRSLEQFEACGCRTLFAREIDDDAERFLELARQIHAEGVHVFVANAILSDLFYYFLTLTRPAPVVMALVAGSLPLFTSREIDWMISWFRATQVDAPGNCSLAPFETDLPENVEAYSKQWLQLPEDSILLLSAGRSAKFQDRCYWLTIVNLLQEYPSCFFAAIGIEKEWVPFLDEVIPEMLHKRIKYLGWREDYLKILAAGDIYLDTYPTGGGVAVVDAMALGLPVVSFHHDYSRIHEQTQASGADEFLQIPELIAERGNFEDFAAIIGTLVVDPEYRASMAKRCQEQVRTTRGSPKRMVRRSEKIYAHVLSERMPHLFHDGAKEVAHASLPPGMVTPDNGGMVWSPEGFELELLRKENYKAWQAAFESGYDSNMGDHRNQFYAPFIEEIGYYDDLILAERIVEFGPGNAGFMETTMKTFPHKEFYLVDISRLNLNRLHHKFSGARNLTLLLNDSRELPLQGIDSVFSFLLCQSVPRRLWKDHLRDVRRMLNPGGTYVFQFAWHPSGSASDAVPLAVSGSHMYEAEQMAALARAVGFSNITLSDPIDLQVLQSDITWYLCRLVR